MRDGERAHYLGQRVGVDLEQDTVCQRNQFTQIVPILHPDRWLTDPRPLFEFLAELQTGDLCHQACHVGVGDVTALLTSQVPEFARLHEVHLPARVTATEHNLVRVNRARGDSCVADFAHAGNTLAVHPREKLVGLQCHDADLQENAPLQGNGQLLQQHRIIFPILARLVVLHPFLHQKHELYGDGVSQKISLKFLPMFGPLLVSVLRLQHDVCGDTHERRENYHAVNKHKDREEALRHVSWGELHGTMEIRKGPMQCNSVAQRDAVVLRVSKDLQPSSIRVANPKPYASKHVRQHEEHCKQLHEADHVQQEHGIDPFQLLLEDFLDLEHP
mmetsp:Transcript_26474/g.66600  ORF Transcript_26474/g.66600 Transcript_26474/m.66600 type:complete len:331 (+) Transcript_26474:304-1296(+)